MFNRIPSSLRRWKNKFFIPCHQTLRGSSNKLILLGGIEEGWGLSKEGGGLSLGLSFNKGKIPKENGYHSSGEKHYFVLAEPSTSKPNSWSSPTELSQPWGRHFHEWKSGYFSFCLFLYFELPCLITFSFLADMARSWSKFAEVTRAAHKGKDKVVAGAISFPSKRARNTKDVIIFPPPLPLLGLPFSLSLLL